MRRHPERRTPTQLRVLEIFWWHYSHKAGRKTRPTLRELARQLRPGMTAMGAMSHVAALYFRGDLEFVPNQGWRRWGLSKQGRKRAKQRATVMERKRKRLRRGTRTTKLPTPAKPPEAG